MKADPAAIWSTAGMAEADLMRTRHAAPHGGGAEWRHLGFHFTAMG